MRASDLSRKFWEAPTNIKSGYLDKTNPKNESPKVMEIRNGKIIDWKKLN